MLFLVVLCQVSESLVVQRLYIDFYTAVSCFHLINLLPVLIFFVATARSCAQELRNLWTRLWVCLISMIDAATNTATSDDSITYNIVKPIQAFGQGVALGACFSASLDTFQSLTS